VTTEHRTERRPGTEDTHGAPSGRLPVNGSREGHGVANQERVLAEMSHELGNFFHKLYYWSEHLRSSGTGGHADGTGAEMLERTIRNLQDFLKIALEYFAPVQLNPIRMTAADVLSGFIRQLSARFSETPLQIIGRDGLGQADVLIDPGRISQAFELVVRQIAQQLGEASRLTLGLGSVTSDGRSGVEVRIAVEQPAGESPLFRTAQADVEWALAEKLFELHGGGLYRHADGADERGWVIFLAVSG
jgi:hypothetical protein